MIESKSLVVKRCPDTVNHQQMPLSERYKKSVLRIGKPHTSRSKITSSKHASGTQNTFRKSSEKMQTVELSAGEDGNSGDEAQLKPLKMHGRAVSSYHGERILKISDKETGKKVPYLVSS